MVYLKALEGDVIAGGGVVVLDVLVPNSMDKFHVKCELLVKDS